MERSLVRVYLVELIGAFLLVFLAAGVVCVNHMTTPLGQQPGTAALNGHEPGLAGMALAQGMALAVLLAVTLPLSGGYLNPAVTIMLWVFNRMDTLKTAWLIGAQFLGAVLAGMCLRYSFDLEVLRGARLGAPHLNPIVYPVIHRAALLAGTGIELVLTFFLVLAMFGMVAEGSPGRVASFGAGAALIAAVLVGFPLTGAALNPARWFGPVMWELGIGEAVSGRGPMSDVFVYVAGPILGALLGGLFCFRLLPREAVRVAETAADGARGGVTQIKAKK